MKEISCLRRKPTMKCSAWKAKNFKLYPQLKREPVKGDSNGVI